MLGLGCLSTVLLLSALVNEKAFNYIIGIASLLFFFVYILQTIGLLVGYRKGTIPQAEPGTFDLGRWRLPLYVTALVVFLAVAVALLFLPQFASNKWVFLGVVAVAAAWWATGLRSRLRRGEAGSDYAKTHLTEFHCLPEGLLYMTHDTADLSAPATSSPSSPGAIREDTPPGSVIQYSDYELDTSSPFAGGVAWIEGEYVPARRRRISIFDTGFGHSDLTYTVAHVWHGNIFRLGDHLDRLLDGARKLRLDPGYSKDELAEITKRCVAMSQLRESFVNLTVTRGYGKRKGEKDLSKLTHQVYIYAIPYLWAFPPHEQIFGTTAIVPRHVRRAGPQHRRPDHQELPVGRPDRGQLRGQGPRCAHRDPDGLRQLRRRGPRLQRRHRQGRQAGLALAKRVARHHPQDRVRDSPTRWASRPRCATSPATSCTTPTN